MMSLCACWARETWMEMGLSIRWSFAFSCSDWVLVWWTDPSSGWRRCTYEAEDGSSRVLAWLWCSWLLSYIFTFSSSSSRCWENKCESIDMVLLLDIRIIIVEFLGFSFLFFSFLFFSSLAIIYFQLDWKIILWYQTYLLNAT